MASRQIASPLISRRPTRSGGPLPLWVAATAPGSGALRLTAVRLPLAPAGCKNSRWIATVESRDAVLLVAPLRLPIWTEWLLLYPPAATRASPAFIAFATNFGIGAQPLEIGVLLIERLALWPGFSTQAPNATNGTLCHEARWGLLVLTAGPLR